MRFPQISFLALSACSTILVFTQTHTAGAKAVGNTQDLNLVTSRYEHWILGEPSPVLQKNFPEQRFQQVVNNARRALNTLKKTPEWQDDARLYNTLKKGPDSQEVSLLIKHILPHLSTAYQLKPTKERPNPYYQNQEILKQILRVFDRLHNRGFRKPMLMPWKSAEVKKVPTDRAVITDFHLRTSGFAMATFLMRKELAKHSRLARTLETCR